ncbi:unnamed protein product, partial [Schistosoma curassoni]|uniref:Sox C-terminal domain-containing protein n=1 Tax=Schistosoma curassoni TaxID=6186 RepID=A0A183L0J9_9TREM
SWTSNIQSNIPSSKSTTILSPQHTIQHKIGNYLSDNQSFMMTSTPCITSTPSTPSVISTTSTATTITSTSTTTTTTATSSNCSDYTIINQYPNTLQTFNKQSNQNNNDNLSVFYLNHSTNIIDHYNQSLLLNQFNHKQINKSIENGNQSITPINLIDFIDKQLYDKKSFKYDIIIDNSIINDSKDSMDDNNANTLMYMINNQQKQQQQQSNSSQYDSNHDNISSISTDFV